MKHLRYFAAAAVFIGGCGVLPALAQAPTARYTLDLSWKDVAFTNSMALAELAIVEVRNIGNATPEGLIYYLSDREGTAMALGTNIVAGTVSNSSVGVLNLQTSELRAFFAGLNPYAERTFSFSVWDSANDILLGSGPVAVRNNPLADQLLTGWTNVPEVVESELLAAIAGLVAMVDAGDTIARADISSLQEALYNLEIGGVNFGTNSTSAYRGDWGASVSNLAASAYSLAISNDNAVLRSIRTVPAVAAYAEAGASDLPWLATNSASLILSGLTSGSIGIRVETTNDTGIALYSVAVKDSGGEVLATIHPACDGTRQSASWPWNDSEELTVEISGLLPIPVCAESAILTSVQVETWRDLSLVGRTNDLADQHLLVDYPTTDRHAANKDYADAAAQAALDLALGEIGTATFNRDLAGFVQRWNPRFDSFASSNSLTTLYGGSTALRLDGNAAQIVPEIKAFSVEAGTVATLTVWSYAGGATNLVPQVTTNLITGPWESKPENVVSATNVDQYTAQVVFTNDAERTLFVRLIDTSGGDSVPVFRIFGGIAFGDGDAITNWPRGDVLGATINPPHTVATNDGLLAFTIGATGSGFPLTNDVSAAGFDLQGVGWFSAQNATISNNATVNNSLSVKGSAQIGRTLAVHDDMTVYGNLAVIGYSSNTQWHYLNVYTQVNGGTFTNFITENRYSTNNVYLVTNIVNTTYTTQFIDYVSVVGSDVDYSLSANVMLPHLRDYRDGNAEAIGTWDFADATVSNLYLPPDAIQTASIAALAGGVATIDLGSNWCWRLDASGDITAINFSTAGLKEGAMNANSVKGILLEVSRGSTANWVWGGHLSHITNTAPPADAVSHLLLIGPSQDVTGTNGWAVY